MTKRNLSKYCKIGTVLLLDAVQVWAICAVLFGDTSDSDFVGFGLMLMLFYFVSLNLWAFLIYFFTGLIRIGWLRDVLFYLLLLAGLFSPLVLFNL